MGRAVLHTMLAAFGYAVIILALGQQSTRADTESPHVVLGPAARDLVVGPGMNAAGRDLQGCEFVGQDLTGALFDGCNFHGVRVIDCILSRGSFRRAILTGIRTLGCEISGADFSDAIVNGDEHNFSEPLFVQPMMFTLSPEQLVTTRSYKTRDLHRCIIRGTWDGPASKGAVFDFHGANLRDALLTDGDFSDCSLAGAHISRITLKNVTMSFQEIASTADFRGRHLSIRLGPRGMRALGMIGMWEFSGIDLEGSDFWVLDSNADFTDAKISGCTLRGSLTKAQLYSTRSYKDGNLTRVVWAAVDLSGCDFSGANLTGSRFGQCDLSYVRLDDAVITDVDFLSVLGFCTF